MCFLLFFYFSSIIFTFVTNTMYFMEALVKLRICSFHYVFCRQESSKTCHFSIVFTLLLLTMVSVSYCRHTSRACFHPFRLSKSQGMFNLGQFFKIPKQKIWKPAYCHQPVPCSLLKHTVTVNQSVHYIETLMEFCGRWHFSCLCYTLKYTLVILL